ncbi:MAG TPA: HEAT repeat domain-containing protein [Polyangiaceae bacterium]|nr:HEAT repeat domain-containing protein [Polyangiaceae bacterium]
MHHRLTWLAVVLAICATAGAAPPKGHSSERKPEARQPAAKTAKAPAGAREAELERLRGVLASGDESAILAALAQLGSAPAEAAAAAPLVEEVLARGANVRVTIAALDTAAVLQQSSSSVSVAPYVRHRRPELRRAAARALVATGGPLAVEALRQGLASKDAQVRATSADGLGKLGARDSVDDLFAVLGHETPEAATSIALLCSPAQCDRLMALVGKLKFETLEAGFVPLLLRPTAELADENKLRYVERLRRLATPGARASLQTALAQLPEAASPTLRSALLAAMRTAPIDEGSR